MRLGWLLAAGLLLALPVRAQTADTLYTNDAFTVTSRGVTEGPFEARAVSATQLRSSYLYDTAREPRLLLFKFALNAEDNEAPPGTDHQLYLMPEDGALVTLVYRFGEIEAAGPAPRLERPVQGAFDVTFRLDLRPVLQAFEEEGAYTPPHGRSIAAEDFEGVYVAGSENPLSWDFNAFTDAHRLTDPDGDGIYEATLTFELGGSRPFEDGEAVWTPDPAIDVSAYPSYSSGQPLIDALYRLSLEELVQDVRDDGAFMAGAKWTGVWTRDISYSIVLSLALLDPEASITSLMAKTRDGLIIQDTGTGGSWPISTDRMTWALAAWEVYLVTGDADWLRTAYDHIRRSAEADLLTARNPETGLFYGESSFLDWREQTYPRWMEPKDIYRSQTLGTNAVHHATYRILAQMAEALGEPSARWQAVADEVAAALNAYLWQADAGYYGQYLYGGRYLSLSPRAEALGAALTVLYGISDSTKTARMMEAFPLVPYGVPSIAPQIPGIPPYHNNGIWPFVVAYWTWAGAEAGHAATVEHGLGSIYRAAALFLTNKENMVAETGHFQGTQINSDRQLWSVAGNLATVYRIFFGLRYAPDHLTFRPFVPEPYAGTRMVRGLPWREATLDVTLEGYGRLAVATLDGERLPVTDGAVQLPADLTGAHTLVLVLDDTVAPSTANVRPVQFTPETPSVRKVGDGLLWEAVPGAIAYEVWLNGEHVAMTTAPRYPLPDAGAAEALHAWQVRAVGPDGLVSFKSAPVRLGPDALRVIPRGGPARLTRTDHTTLTFTVTVPEAGRYALDARYANGSGPVNTNNKAAIRSLFVNGERAGTLVMPQRGDGAWDDLGYTNTVPVRLHAGENTVTLRFTDADENMNPDVNEAILHHLRLVPLDKRFE